MEVVGSGSNDVPPEIIIAPPEDGVTMVKNTAVTELQCIGNAKPLHELETVWLKDGVPIGDAGIPFSFNDLWNRTLSLLQADFSHEGTYTCQVGMRTGGPRLTRDTEVRVIGEYRAHRLLSFSISIIFKKFKI